MEELMKEFEEFMEEKMNKEEDKNREKFSKKREEIKEKTIEMIDEAENVFVAVNEKHTFMSGDAGSVLACVCCILEGLEENGVPKEMIKDAILSAYFGEDTEGFNLIAELNKMIDKM